eukprot:4098577-Amphidinium_carterae.1
MAHIFVGLHRLGGRFWGSFRVSVAPCNTKEHIECVAEHVPSHQLLVFNAAEDRSPIPMSTHTNPKLP